MSYQESPWPSHDPERVLRTAVVEYLQGTADPLYRRWGAYDFSTQTNPEYRSDTYYRLVYNALDCPSDGTLLDLGGNDGRGVASIQLAVQHTGPTIVADINERIFQNGIRLNEIMDSHFSNYRPIQFVVCRGEDMGFADSSVDSAMALFMLYHAPNPAAVLQELVRVTKPGAKIAIATSGPKNKIRQREFEADIAQYLDIQPPPIFSEPFNTDVARRELSRFFDVTNPLPPWRCSMRVPSIMKKRKWGKDVDDTQYDEIDGATLYLGSLYSMRRHFDPVPSLDDWERAVNVIVRPKIYGAFEADGYFDDEIDREFFICTNRKTT